MGRVKRFGVSIDEELCRRFDQHIADRLIATRGVKHGKLTMSTTGQDL